VTAFIQRKLQWEFWPAWAAYLPLLPYLAWLGVKHRSATLFTAANPGIPTSGLLGEPKADILARLASSGAVADFAIIHCGAPARERFSAARRFMARLGLEFPVVVKPNVGERGNDVAIIRSDVELQAYLRGATGDTLIQRHVPGLEFGIFYYRRPGAQAGLVTSITAKHFPEVIGDGKTTVEQLINQDSRARLMLAAYRKSCERPMDSVPAPGERVRLVEVGSHCRGAIFLNALHLLTPALASEIDRIAKTHDGFYLGRFDVRTPSLDDFQAGRLTVLELNGVAAEATHIYDPSVSITEAYRVMLAQWRTAFETGAENRKRGVRPTPARELLKLVLERRNYSSRPNTGITAPVICEASSEAR
jgi:hypothetical protein